MAKNKVTGTTVRGSVKQLSDVANSENSVENSEVADLTQRIVNKQSSMRFLGGKATGTLGIVFLAIVIVAYLVYRILIHHAK